MEIIVETTEQDHIDFYKAYGLKRNWPQRIAILVVADLLLSAFEPLSSFYLTNVSLIGVILLPLFFWIPYSIAKKRFKNAYDDLLAPIGQKTFKPFTVGIEIADETGTIFLRYDDIKQVGEADGFIFLISSGAAYYILPTWCFSSVHEAGRFLRLIKNGVANAKGIEPKRPLTFKPGYLIGILCLIPMIGAITGVVLIILGIVHYKDKVFIFIGSVGIVITIAVYSSLFYFVQNSGIVDEGFANMAQIQLNDLVKNIEFYKLQNGSYPDSLQQIETKDSFMSIDDPLQSFKGNKKSVTYQYHRKGNKYLL